MKTHRFIKNRFYLSLGRIEISLKKKPADNNAYNVHPSHSVGTACMRGRWQQAKKRRMTLQQIFENNDYLKFREKELSQVEINEIIDQLNQSKGIVWFKQFMKFRETLPDELLKPILISGIQYGDVSYPKRWMPSLIRIYSQEQIDEILFEIIKESPIRDKCKFTSLFYWNKFSRIVRHKDGKPHEELGVVWKWTGEFYVEEYVKSNLEETKRRNDNLKVKRYEFLITQFQQIENLVYRYFIALELPKSLDKFPTQLKSIAKEVVDIITNKEFPKWVNPLKEQVKGNSELEKLLYEELMWQKEIKPAANNG